MRKVCFILLLYLSLYDFYSLKIQPRACSMPLSWTVVEYHSQSHWATICLLCSNRDIIQTNFKAYSQHGQEEEPCNTFCIVPIGK